MILIYAGTDIQTSSGVQNIEGALIFSVMAMGFASTQNIVLLFPDERPIFLREVNNNMYTASAYFFGKVISEIPMSLILPTLFSLVIYWSLGLSTAHPWNFPFFSKHIPKLNQLIAGALILEYYAAGAYAFVVGSMFSDKQVAMTMIPLVVMPLMLFAGFFVNANQIPIYFIEISYISFFKYAYQAVFIVIYFLLSL